MKSMKLQCPNCESTELYVVETRQSPTAIYRTRKCRDCKWNYTTTETFAADSIPNTIRKPKKYVVDLSAT